MTQLTPEGLVRILGHVTLIMVIPIVGGTVAGLFADGMLRSSPLFALGGVVAGTLVAIVGIWLYIHAGTRGRREDGGRGDRT
jgi:amino acid transporter